MHLSHKRQVYSLCTIFLILSALSATVLLSCDNSVTSSDSPSVQAAKLTADPSHSFLLDVLSTGKSDCILIRADGHALLIDTADSDDTTSILSHLYRLGISHLDYLILTHLDNDHIGGSPGLVNALSVGEILTPNYMRRSSAFLALENAAQTRGVPLTRLSESRTLTLGKATLQIDVTSLFGEETVTTNGDDSGDAIDENNFSLITCFSYGTFRALLLGDAQKARLEEYTASHFGLTADFIKLPHHGTYTKALRRLLEQCQPVCTAVCVDSPDRPDTKLIKMFENDFSSLPLFLTCYGIVHLAGNTAEWVFWQEGTESTP